jgi:kynurenine formamidase
LQKNIVVLEGLIRARRRPANISPVALPLNLRNADGAPARVILTN